MTEGLVTATIVLVLGSLVVLLPSYHLVVLLDKGKDRDNVYYELEDKLVRLLMDFPPFPTSSSFPRARGSPGYRKFTSEVAQRSSDACHPYPTLYCFLCHGELAIILLSDMFCPSLIATSHSLPPLRHHDD